MTSFNQTIWHSLWRGVPTHDKHQPLFDLRTPRASPPPPRLSLSLSPSPFSISLPLHGVVHGHGTENATSIPDISQFFLSLYNRLSVRPLRPRAIIHAINTCPSPWTHTNQQQAPPNASIKRCYVNVPFHPKTHSHSKHWAPTYGTLHANALSSKMLQNAQGNFFMTRSSGELRRCGTTLQTQQRYSRNQLHAEYAWQTTVSLAGEPITEVATMAHVHLDKRAWLLPSATPCKGQRAKLSIPVLRVLHGEYATLKGGGAAALISIITGFEYTSYSTHHARCLYPQGKLKTTVPD